MEIITNSIGLLAFFLGGMGMATACDEYNWIRFWSSIAYLICGFILLK